MDESNQNPIDAGGRIWRIVAQLLLTGLIFAIGLAAVLTDNLVSAKGAAAIAAGLGAWLLFSYALSYAILYKRDAWWARWPARIAAFLFVPWWGLILAMGERGHRLCISILLLAIILTGCAMAFTAQSPETAAPFLSAVTGMAFAVILTWVFYKLPGWLIFLTVCLPFLMYFMPFLRLAPIVLLFAYVYLPRGVQLGRYLKPQYPRIRPLAEGNGGFTLIELLIAIAILGILLSSLTFSMVNTIRHAKWMETRTAIQTALQSEMALLMAEPLPPPSGEPISLPVPPSDFGLPDRVSGSAIVEDAGEPRLAKIIVSFTEDLGNGETRRYQLVGFKAMEGTEP